MAQHAGFNVMECCANCKHSAPIDDLRLKFDCSILSKQTKWDHRCDEYHFSLSKFNEEE